MVSMTVQSDLIQNSDFSFTGFLMCKRVFLGFYQTKKGFAHREMLMEVTFSEITSHLFVIFCLRTVILTLYIHTCIHTVQLHLQLLHAVSESECDACKRVYYKYFRHRIDFCIECFLLSKCNMTQSS